MRSFATLAALGALAWPAVADDFLFSKHANHLHRRSMDDQGNWNVCTSSLPSPPPPRAPAASH